MREEIRKDTIKKIAGKPFLPPRLSFDEGMQKPNLEIFKRCLEKLDVNPPKEKLILGMWKHH